MDEPHTTPISREAACTNAALQTLIQRLDLSPHPEGGWFKRIYTATTAHETPRGTRAQASSIWYLLGGACRVSKLHRNRSDILHFLIEGGPIEYAACSEAQPSATSAWHLHRLSVDGARFALIPGQHWKATRLAAGASYALIAEVVTPAFDFADHEFGPADAGPNWDALAEPLA